MKVCQNCGKELSEGGSLCAFCGDSVERTQKNIFAVLKDKNKKMWLYVLIPAVVIVVLLSVVLANRLGKNDGFSTPEKAAAQYMIALRGTCDADDILECFPDYFIGRMMEEYEVSGRKELVEWFKMNGFNGFGHKVVIKNSSKTDWPFSIADSLREKGDWDSSIDDACYVAVHFECDGKEQFGSVTCVKIKGRWYVIDW